MQVFVVGNNDSYNQFWYESFRKVFAPIVDRIKLRLEDANLSGIACVVLGFPSKSPEIAEELRRLRETYPSIYALLLLPICDCCLEKVALGEGVDVTDWCPQFSITREENENTGWADTGISYRYVVSEDQFVDHVIEDQGDSGRAHPRRLREWFERFVQTPIHRRLRSSGSACLCGVTGRWATERSPFFFFRDFRDIRDYAACR